MRHVVFIAVALFVSLGTVDARAMLQLIVDFQKAAPVGPSPAIDASGAVSANNGSVSTVSVNLTTTSTNDIILVWCYGVVSGSGGVASSSVTGASLSWTKRVEYTQVNSGSLACQGGSGPCSTTLSEWWALSSGALSAQSMTCNFSVSSNATLIVATGVSGANTSTPFDSNAGLVYNANSTIGTNTAGHVTGINTSNPNDLLVYLPAESKKVNGVEWDTCSGWTRNIGPGGCAGGVAIGGTCTLMSLQVSSPQSGFSTCVNSNVGMYAGWTAMVDAIAGP